jgi:hypothetical protein
MSAIWNFLVWVFTALSALVIFGSAALCLFIAARALCQWLYGLFKTKDQRTPLRQTWSESAIAIIISGSAVFGSGMQRESYR